MAVHAEQEYQNSPMCIYMLPIVQDQKMACKSCLSLQEIMVVFPNGTYALKACQGGLHSIKQISDTSYESAKTLGTATLTLGDRVELTETLQLPSCLLFTIDWFQKYFRDPKQVPPQLPELCPVIGTPFRRRVWECLALNVTPGSFVTYKQLAKLSGHPRAIRAVGSAMANNPFSVVVPCHRVLPTNKKASNSQIKPCIGKNASIVNINVGRYSSLHGSRTKLWLLRHEGALGVG